MKKPLFFWLGFSVFVALSVVRADLVKLKDGTVLDGDILSEDDKQIIIDAEFASGTITKRETVKKSDIAEVVRSTEAQKLERQMLRDREALQKYQLDPTSSLSLAQYDQVINTIFRRYLAQYTNSPYQREITDKITQWQTERDRVAAGETKYRGRWMSAAEAAKLIDQDRAKRLLQQGQAMISNGRYDEAVKYFDNLSQTSQDPQIVAEARRLKAESYQRWLDALNREKQRIDEEIQSAQDRMTRAQQAKDRAQANLSKVGGDGDVHRMGANAFTFEVARADSEAKVAQKQVDQLHKNLTAVQQLVTNVQARAAPPPPPASGPTSTVARATPPQTTSAADGVTMTDAVMAWMKRYWMFVVGGLVIGLWLIGRLVTRT